MATNGPGRCRTGRIASRYSQSLRGWITEIDEAMTLGTDGLPTDIVIRGVTPSGDAAETFAIDSGKASWTADRATAARSPRRAAIYLPAGGTASPSCRWSPRWPRPGTAGIELYPSGKATLSDRREP